MRTEQSPLEKVIVYGLLIAISITMLFPWFWMLSTALKPATEVFTNPPRLLPSAPTLKNFFSAWQVVPFWRIFGNSAFVAATRTLVAVFLNALAGYAFAKYEFKGRDFLFMLVLSTLMVPFQVIMISVYLMIAEFNWINTFQGLIVPGLSGAFGVFLMRQFFMTLPTDLMEAARIDGCSEFRIFWNIMLPLAKPALAVLATFGFMDGWNDFLLPLIVVESERMYTVQLGLAIFRGDLWVDWPELMSMNIIAILPVLVLFIAFQKYLVQGIALSGIKG
ncbi:MAG: carbohydrate ABC transporter permease [Firmicutes bacterium]|mgnify:CR=1 FL=1|nr:carbohydrate ABC transporter permease [Bacillota bacterium]